MNVPINYQTQVASEDQNQLSSKNSTTLSAAPLEIGPICKRYEVQQILACGGMGAVHQAYDTILHRSVAVKVIHDSMGTKQYLQRFAEEAIITAQLQHPSIPPVYDLGTLPDGQTFLAMKLIQGHTLESLIQHNRNSLNVLGIFEAICQAIGYAHANRIIHRDLKPANIMVGAFGEVQVMDWGLAKVIGSDEIPPPDHPLTQTPPPVGIGRRDESSQTVSGCVMGTPAYMPPEQSNGDIEKISERSDVFCLGGILHAMLTGLPPFPNGDLETRKMMLPHSIMKNVHERLDRCGGEPAWIELAKQCLAGNPADRPANGDAVAKIVAKLRRDADERAKQALIAKASSDARRRWFVGSAAAVFTVLSIGVGVSVWQLLRARDAERQTADQLVLTEQAKERAELEATRAQQAEAQAVAANTITKQALTEATQANETIFDVFADFDIRRVKQGKEPLEAVLAKRLITAGKRLNADTIHDPLVLANLQNRLGQTLLSLGYPREAITQFQSARTIRAQQLGADHADTLHVVVDLARAHLDVGQVQESVQLNEQVVKTDPAQLGPNHPDRLMAMNNLARGYQESERNDEAMNLYQETLERRKASLGLDHIDTIKSMANLANGYNHLKDWAKALPQYEEALTRSQAALGPDHFITVAILGNYAGATVNANKMASAIPLLERVLARDQAFYGLDHPKTLETMTNLCVAHLKTKVDDKVIALLEQTLARHRAKYGPDLAESVRAAFQLGMGFQLQGQNEKAVSMLQFALPKLIARFGVNHSQTLSCHELLAICFMNMKQYPQAIEHWEHFFRGSKSKALESKCYLGICYVRGGRAKDAIPILEQCAEAAANNSKLESAIPELVNAYIAVGRRTEAAHLITTMLKRDRATLAPQSLELANLVTNYATGLMQIEQFATAELLYREGLTIYDRLAPNSRELFDARSHLGELLLRQKQYAAAEPLLISGYDGLVRERDSMPTDQRNAAFAAGQRLIQLYEATNRREQANSIRAKCPKEVAPQPRMAK